MLRCAKGRQDRNSLFTQSLSADDMIRVARGSPKDSDAITLTISGYRDRSREMRRRLGKDVGGISEASDVSASKGARSCAGGHCGGLSRGRMHGAQSARRGVLAIKLSAKRVAKKEICVLGAGDDVVAS